MPAKSLDEAVATQIPVRLSGVNTTTTNISTGGQGIANEENPLVYVDLTNHSYFQFIGNNEPNIGHLDGLLSTGDSLFAADLAAIGFGASGAATTGVIYQLKSLVTRLAFRVNNNTLELTWPAGVLQQAESLSGPWNDVPGAASPYPVALNLNPMQVFYRTRN